MIGAHQSYGQGAKKKTLTGEITEDKAMKLVFGNYDDEEEVSAWKPSAADITQLKIDSGAKDVFSSILLAKPMHEGNFDKYILLTGTVPKDYTCHACPATISGFLFSKTGGGWQLDAEQKFIARLGEYGEGPATELVRIGPDKYGVLFRPLYTGTYQEEGMILFEVTDSGLTEALSLPATSGQGGDNKPYKYSSKLNFVQGKNSSYYDIKISTTGSRKGSDGKVTSVDETKTYIFNGKKYVPDQGAQKAAPVTPAPSKKG